MAHWLQYIHKVISYIQRQVPSNHYLIVEFVLLKVLHGVG